MAVVKGDLRTRISEDLPNHWSPQKMGGRRERLWFIPNHLIPHPLPLLLPPDGRGREGNREGTQGKRGGRESVWEG